MVWDPWLRALSTMEAQGIYYIELKREAELLHVPECGYYIHMKREAEITAYRWTKEIGFISLGRNSFWKDWSSGEESWFGEWGGEKVKVGIFFTHLDPKESFVIFF